MPGAQNEMPKIDLVKDLTEDGHPTCMDLECMSEKDLRKLPCGHLLCRESIGE